MLLEPNLGGRVADVQVTGYRYRVNKRMEIQGRENILTKAEREKKKPGVFGIDRRQLMAPHPKLKMGSV